MRRPAGNVLWSGLEAAVSALLSFASAFVVARLVGPAEVGIGAAVVAVHVLLWVAVNALFADALVQRPGLDPGEAAAAFWAAIATGALAALAQAGLGFALAAALGDPRIVAMSLALAAALPLVGAGGAVQGLLTRARAYRVLAARALVGQGLGTAAGIALAFAGAGAWALVCQQLVTSLAGAAALLAGAGFRPARSFAWAPVRRLLAIGLPLTAATLVQQGRYRVFAVLIGATAGPAVLGQVHMAFRLVDTGRDLAMTALWRLALPAMAERQADLPALRGALARFAALSGLVLFPAIGAAALTLRPLVRLLLGPVWAPAAQAGAILLLVAVQVFLTFPTGVAVIARGRPGYALATAIAATALTLAGVALLRPDRPVTAAAIWLAAQFATIPWMLAMARRELRCRLSALVGAALPGLALAAAATAAGWALPALLGEPAAPLPRMLLRLAVAGAIYLPGAALLLGPSVRDALAAIGLRPRPA